MSTVKKSPPKSPSARQLALAAIAALSAPEVMRAPSYPVARASWLRGLLVPLAQDHADLLDAPLDPPLTEEETALYPELVELIGETVASKQAEVAEHPLTPDERGFLVGLRARQQTLDRAFRVRLRRDREGLRTLADIRRGVAHDPEDALSDARRLVALVDSDTHAGWVAGLKKGEPAAVDALRTAVPALEALATRVAGTSKGTLARDQLRRAWTLALRLADRIVTAGKYQTSDVPGRAKDYGRFRKPPVRRPRAKTADAAAPAKASTPRE